MSDPRNTPENWRRVSNTSLVKGDLVDAGGRSHRVTGFGPYFLWAEDLETEKERRLFRWDEPDQKTEG